MKIKFKNKETRKHFFSYVGKKYGKNWKEFQSEFRIPKYTLERYKNGKTLLPEKLFIELYMFLEKQEKQEILQNTTKFEDNFGQIKGGKIAYKINIKAFEEGRKKGINSIKKSRKKTYKKKIKEISNIKLNPDLCEFIGAFIGDGFFNCYNNKVYQIEFSGDSRLDLEYYTKTIIPNIKKSFHYLNPHIYFVKNKNAIRIVFYSRELYRYLKDIVGFTPGRKTHTVSIPEKILENKLLIYHTIRGIFDTDGGVFLDKRKGYKKPYPRIIFQTVSKNLHTQLHEVLSKHFKLYSKHNKNREIYLIEIYGHENIKKWMSLIGFSNQRHFKKIASMA